ncbi:hypothetical protein A2415_02915 [candidate division WWE3 bacterium RIFOXYC1_FULL_39_7]|uniref:GGDEF domain-containing protein n=2 Tax=Katanobacteria TaxID=422282 RepID=A0A1F4X8I7_UNCKA|nr:MAG: hypothetical protein A2415_02915 [candidate division WWE3 bacterium RIFOXYC1_FULL_39_7]OGC77986.1 MAG: hypothetical protein A2619_02760 [candidate division WWE3 bacterium RIFOXYD1_FULL_39_9]
MSKQQESILYDPYDFAASESNPFEGVTLTEKEKERLEELSGAARIREKQELEDARSEIKKLKESIAISDLTHLLYWRSEMAQQMVERYIDEAGRHESEVWLGMFDIDILKHLNDTYGYNKADEVLKTFGNALDSSLRSSDTCYQFGVDEFPILLVGIDREHLEQVTERITENFESGLKKLVEKGTISQEMANESTYSGGFVKAKVEKEYGEGRGVQYEGPKALFDRADTVLHKAKQNGRNSMMVEGEDTPIIFRKEVGQHIQEILSSSDEYKERYGVKN